MVRFERGYARFDVTLTLNRSEMDALISIFAHDGSELAQYMMTRLRAARER